MAMELHVLSDRRLTCIEEWQQAIALESFPLQLARDVELGTIGGFLSVQLEGKNSGFECYYDDVAEIMNADSGLDFGRAWTCALGFRIVGDFTELRSAWMAATAYAHATGGIVYDPQDDKLYSHSEARDLIREIEANWPAMEAAVQAAVKKIASKS
jgi:hypothetical protein